MKDMKKRDKKQLLEHIVHGIFAILGLITVACVLVITLYLVVSGIPALWEIGITEFLFGENGHPPPQNLNSAYCRLYLQVFTVLRVQF